MLRVYSGISSARLVVENDHDESTLRLFTRSIGPSGAATLRRFSTRSAAFARRRTLHQDFDNPMELLVDLPGDDARRQYFARRSHADGFT
jgi:hypothetical protein